MTPTLASSQPPTRHRRPVVALLASLGATVLVLTAAPAATAAVSTAPATATVESEDETEQMTFDGLIALVQKHEAAGEITQLQSVRLQARVRMAASYYYDWGATFRAVQVLEGFKAEVVHPHHNASQLAQDELLAAADELIAVITAPA